MAGKYGPLGTYLAGVPEGQSEVILSFERIEQMLIGQLPASAYQHRAWWSNERDGQHVHAHVWMNAGWRVADVDQSRGVVRFRRSRQ